MTKTVFAAALCAASIVAGAAGHARRLQLAASTKTDWHRVVTEADRDRLRAWHTAWMTALGKARAAGKGSLIDAQEALFDPDRALPDGATPPPGAYRCRVFKLGANGPAAQDFAVLPVQDCRVENEGEVSSLYKVAGNQRSVGLVFTDTPARSVFLGTMVLSDETSAMTYGRDTSRDMAGFVERIGPHRWRLTLPYPRFESLLDVVEITPAPVR